MLKHDNWYDAEFHVNDRVTATLYYSRVRDFKTIHGTIVHIVPAGVAPTDDELKTYLKVTPHDRGYRSLSKASTVARLIVLKENGNHIMIPVYSGLLGYVLNLGGSDGKV